jgi:hypothetical protein
MLVSVELDADFSAGCAHPAMRPPIPATHPHPQCNETGALAMGLRPDADHVLLCRGRCFSLG